MSVSKARTDFTVHLITEFGTGLDRRKCHLGETPEETFMNAWKSLPKRQNKDWLSITWEQDGKEFEVDRVIFFDNRFDFDLTVEQTELA